MIFDKESPVGGHRRSIRQADTFCPVPSHTAGAPWPPSWERAINTRPQSGRGCLRAGTYREVKDTRALNALKALRAAPISMGRGEIPVELCQQPSGFAYFVYSMVLYYERVNTMQNEKIAAPQMVREYKIGNTTYVVKSHSRPDATEDAVSKVKRLIRNDLRKKPQKP